MFCVQLSLAYIVQKAHIFYQYKILIHLSAMESLLIVNFGSNWAAGAVDLVKII